MVKRFRWSKSERPYSCLRSKGFNGWLLVEKVWDFWPLSCALEMVSAACNWMPCEKRCLAWRTKPLYQVLTALSAMVMNPYFVFGRAPEKNGTATAPITFE